MVMRMVLVSRIIRIENAHLTTAGSIHQRDTAEAVPKKNTSLLKDPSKQTQLFKICILEDFSSQSYAQNFLIFWMNHLELMSTPSSSICWTTSTSPLCIKRSSKVKLNFQGNLSQAPQSPLMIFGTCSPFLLSSIFLLAGSDIPSSPLLTIFCMW